jgi:hypothetical protein
MKPLEPAMPPAVRGSRGGLAAALVLLALFGAACEDAVNPFLDDDRHFTIYGYLDTDRDTQYVRVEPLRRTVDMPEPGPLQGVTVTMTEVLTGREILWRDSLLQFTNGTFGHVFKAVFRPRHGHRYRLVVRRDDGAETSAETRVPPRRTVGLGTAATTFGFSGYEMPATFDGVSRRPLSVEVWYRMELNQGEPFRDYPIPYGFDRHGVRTGGSWRVRVELSRDADTLRKRFGIPSTRALPPLYGVGVRISERDSSWAPPGDVFDPITLIEPGTFTNVVGGFGFFGAIGRQKVEWVLPDAVTKAICFTVPQR